MAKAAAPKVTYPKVSSHLLARAKGLMADALPEVTFKHTKTIQVEFGPYRFHDVAFEANPDTGEVLLDIYSAGEMVRRDEVLHWLVTALRDADEKMGAAKTEDGYTRISGGG